MMIERSCTGCGKIFSSPVRARKCDTCRKPRLRGAYVSKTLSPREKQIIALLCEAKENKEIAYALRLTEGTVKVYMSHIFEKTGAVNRVDLAMRSVTGRI